jgi:hypothetical protein
MLSEEPRLQLPSADDVRDQQVIGAVVTELRGAGSVVMGVDQDGLVGFQQPATTSGESPRRRRAAGAHSGA